MMKKITLLLALAASIPNASFAQYSNATLDGPWFLLEDPFDPFNSDAIYLTFDGAGSLVDGGGFCGGAWGGSYTVTMSGSISGSMLCDGSPYPFTGQLHSQDSATLTFTGMPPFILERVMDPGALEGTLTGTLSTDSCGTQNVTLEVDQTGTIIGASGLTPPVTGHVYSDEGVFMGHCFTGGSNGWQEFSIRGYQTGNVLAGLVNLDWGSCGNTSSVLTWQAATGIAENTQHAMDINIYPNPAASTIQIQFAAPYQGATSVNIYDSVGKLASSTMLQRDQQQIDISTLGNGSYLVQVVSDQSTGTQRLVVQR